MSKFIENGLNEHGQTPVTQAMAQMDMVRLGQVLQRGADPNMADAQGFRPIEIAIRANNRNMIDVLLKANAEIKQEDVDLAKTLAVTEKKPDGSSSFDGLAQQLVNKNAQVIRVDYTNDRPQASQQKPASLKA